MEYWMKTGLSIMMILVISECTSNVTEGEYLKHYVNQTIKDSFCSVLNVPFSLLNYSCKIKNNDTTEKLFLSSTESLPRTYIGSRTSSSLQHWNIVYNGQQFLGEFPLIWLDKDAQEEFQQAAEKLSQALTNNFIAENTQRGKFITAFLNRVERVVVSSFLEAPRVQHINTPELDITMKPSYNICSPAVQSFTLISADNIMEVPCILLPRDGDGAILITYKEFNFNNGNYPQKDKKVVINSKVVTGAITNPVSKSLSCPITFRLSHLQPLKSFDKSICVFWDPSKNDWSDKGCETGQSNGTHTNCSCTHLSSFALLMAENVIQEAKDNFKQLVEIFSQELVSNKHIAKNAQRGKFITAFLNSVERFVLTSFLETPRVQHLNTPELDITMKPSYNICSPAVQSFTLVSADNIMEVLCILVPRDGDGAIFITYNEFNFTSNGSYPQTGNKVVINSKVVTGAITNSDSKNLSCPITFRLFHLQPLKPFDKPICVLWDRAKNEWSDKGCETGQSNGTYTNCYCTQLSSFVLLMTMNGIQEVQEEFQQAAEKLSQALAVINLIAENGQRGKFITIFLNTVERVVLLSFLEAPRVQHINTPELEITMKPSYNICSPAVQSFTLFSADNIMEVPCILVPRDGDGAIFITYKVFHFNFNGSYPQTDNKVVINSKVVTGAITNPYSKRLNFPITFRLSHLQPLKPFDKSICVFWDSVKNDWSDKGCETGQSNGTYTNCSCTHLSSFALLMAVNGIQVDFTLNILSYFGLSISVICLGLSLLTFILCRSLRSAHTTVLTALCVCLFLGQLLFMVGIHQTWNRLLCALIAGWLQFLFLCAFCWMTVESVLLFMTVQNLRAVNYMASRKSNFPFLCLLGFGVPAVIVGISAAVRPHQYGTEKNCWLSPGIVWSFIGPVSAFITINTILLVLTLWLLKKRISSLNANVSTLKDTRVLTFKAVAQLFILGCTWGIGYFQFGRLSLVISYLFTICNSLQGAFIFLVHCLLNQQVREEYSKLFYRLCTHKKQDMSTISTLQTASKPPLAASTDSNCDCEPTQPAVLNKNVVSADNSPAEKKEQSL